MREELLKHRVISSQDTACVGFGGQQHEGIGLKVGQGASGKEKGLHSRKQGRV